MSSSQELTVRSAENAIATPIQRVAARATRYSVHWPVILSDAEEGETTGRIVSISHTGVFFLSVGERSLHNRVVIRTDSKDLPALHFEAQIVWERQAIPGWFAYGAKFVRMSQAHFEQLCLLLEELKALRNEHENLVKEARRGRNRAKIQVAR